MSQKVIGIKVDIVDALCRVIYNRYVHGESVENQVIWKMSTLEALSTLTERQQEAMLLYYVEGYTQQEIGRMLGISTTAVKNRLESGLQRIRKHIYAMGG